MVKANHVAVPSFQRMRHGLLLKEKICKIIKIFSAPSYHNSILPQVRIEEEISYFFFKFIFLVID